MTCNGEICTCLFDEVEGRHLLEARADERNLIIEMLNNARTSGHFPLQRSGLEKAVRLIELMDRVRPQ